MNLLINADIGEGIGDDEGLMPLIQACNIACGGHAGNIQEIQKTIALAKRSGVHIGAHPSYPDRDYFGRRSLNIKASQLYQSLNDQIQLLQDQLAGEYLHHIKPHGALYHDCVNLKSTAQIFLEVVEKTCPDTIILTAPKSELGAMAKKRGYKVWKEAFLDRAYTATGQLLSRSKKGAVLSTPEAIKKRILDLTQKGGVYSNDGQWIPLVADTYCVHGDHPNATDLLKKALDKIK